MANTYFISDIHLGAGNKKSEKIKERALLNFLDHVGQYGDQLVIVGDLFDFWFEYRSVIPRGYTRAICGLARLRELGKEIHYVAGNHDFWMRNFLNKELGFKIHYDDFELEMNDKRFYIMHGDGVAKHDKGYRFLKRVFRNKINIFLYSLLHPDLGIPLAQWVSGISRNHTSFSGPPEDHDYVELAMQKFELGFDYFLFGHLHSPKIQMFGQKVYINLGDWINNFTYAIYDGEDLALKTWQV